MKNRVKKGLNPSVGASSILMIFMVLCLTTFGILSFSTARADLNLTKKNAAAVLSYYDADAKAQELLQQISGAARGAKTTAEAKALLAELAKTADLALSQDDEALTVGYLIPVGSAQALEVEAELTPGAPLRVTKHKLVTTAQWNGDDRHLDVWQG